MSRSVFSNFPKFSNKLVLSALLAFASLTLQAQEGSDIWLGQLDVNDKRPIRTLVQITDTERYSNQPYFFNNMLYFTQMEAENAQTDIYSFDLNTGEQKNLTQSLSSEYSPTPIPSQEAMSVIRVNAGGKQELWSLDMQGNATKNLVPAVEPVGYHVWLDETKLLLFVLGEPNTLQLAYASHSESEADATPDAKLIDENIGASLYQYKHSDWLLYSQTSEEGHWIKGYNKQTHAIRQIAKLPDETQYFTISPSGFAFTSDGKAVYYRQIIENENKLSPFGKWQSIDIDEPACAKGVSRIAIAPDESMIALVCNRKN